MEMILANEIVSAAWRLERCSQLDAALQGDSEPGKSFASFVERARETALNLLSRVTADLTKMQTDREIRRSLFPQLAEVTGLGLTDIAGVHRAMAHNAGCIRKDPSFAAAIVRRIQDRQLAPAQPSTSFPQNEANSAKRSQSESAGGPAGGNGIYLRTR